MGFAAVPSAAQGGGGGGGIADGPPPPGPFGALPSGPYRHTPHQTQNVRIKTQDRPWSVGVPIVSDGCVPRSLGCADARLSTFAAGAALSQAPMRRVTRSPASQVHVGPWWPQMASFFAPDLWHLRSFARTRGALDPKPHSPGPMNVILAATDLSAQAGARAWAGARASESLERGVRMHFHSALARA